MKRIHASHPGRVDRLLPIPRLVEDVVAVSTHTLAAEQGRETAANGDHLLWDTHLIFGFGLANDELSNLYHETVRN